MPVTPALKKEFLLSTPAQRKSNVAVRDSHGSGGRPSLSLYCGTRRQRGCQEHVYARTSSERSSPPLSAVLHTHDTTAFDLSQLSDELVTEATQHPTHPAPPPKDVLRLPLSSIPSSSESRDRRSTSTPSIQERPLLPSDAHPPLPRCASASACGRCAELEEAAQKTAEEGARKTQDLQDECARLQAEAQRMRDENAALSAKSAAASLRCDELQRTMAAEAAAHDTQRSKDAARLCALQKRHTEVTDENAALKGKLHFLRDAIVRDLDSLKHRPASVPRGHKEGDTRSESGSSGRQPSTSTKVLPTPTQPVRLGSSSTFHDDDTSVASPVDKSVGHSIPFGAFEDLKIVRAGKAGGAAVQLEAACTAVEADSTTPHTPKTPVAAKKVDVELLLLQGANLSGDPAVHHRVIRALREVTRTPGSGCVLPILGTAVVEGSLYAVAERAAGSVTLQDYVQRRRNSGSPFTQGEVLTVAKKILRGLHDVHQRCSHRDLSTLQIVMSGDPYVTGFTTLKVRRFGLTRAPPLLEFTSPESIETRTFSNENDMWSFGVVMYEVVTYGLVQAFSGKTQAAVEKEVLDLYRAAKPIFTKPPCCSQELWDALIAPCFKPSQQRPTAEQLLLLLESGKLRTGADIPLSEPSV